MIKMVTISTIGAAEICNYIDEKQSKAKKHIQPIPLFLMPT